MRSRFVVGLAAWIIVTTGCSATTTETSAAGPEAGTSSLLPEDVDWVTMTTADVFAAADVDSYRQRRAMVIFGPEAEAASLVGDFEVVASLTNTPELAMSMQLQAAASLQAALLSNNGGSVAARVIGDRVWIGTEAGEWQELTEPGSSNPLFGPLAGVYDTMLTLVPGASEAAQFLGYEEVNGRPSLHYSTGSFAMSGDSEIRMPVDEIEVWIDEAGFLLRADVSTSSRDDDGNVLLGYRVRYEVFDLGADITVSPPPG